MVWPLCLNFRESTVKFSGVRKFRNFTVAFFPLSISVNLSSDVDDKLKIYRTNFEKAYLEATESFYKLKAPQYLQANGVQNYMKYADAKLKEEETRAIRYLETGWGCTSVSAVSHCFIE